MRLSTIVTAGGLGLTLVAFLGRFGQPFELFSQFRVQYVFVAAATLAWALIARCKPALAMAVVMLGLNAIVIAEVMARAAPIAEGPIQVRLVWANLYRKPEALTALAAQAQDADILALTEVPADGLRRIQAAFPAFKCLVFDADHGNPFAVAIAARAPCPSRGAAGNTRYVDVGKLRVVALHARPPWDNRRTAARNASIRQAFAFAAAAPDSVVVGDFNATPWSPAFGAETTAGLRRARCGWPWHATWRSVDPLTGLTLDQVFATPALGVDSCTIGTEIGSDHRPLRIGLTLR